MYPGREVYPSSPLELVVAEFRFAYTPALVTPSVHESFADLLADVAPVASLEDVHSVSLNIIGSQPKVETAKQLRLLSDDSTLSIALQAQRLVVETSSYTTFESFAQIVSKTIDALCVGRKVGRLERVGLRYIDEVRLPTPWRAETTWDGWIDERLLSSTTVMSGIRSFQSVMEFELPDNQRLTFRYGAFLQGTLLNEGKLKLRKRDRNGPYFLLDMDSYREASQVDPFDRELIIKILSSLHRPAGEIFAASLTEKLKNEVLRVESP